MTSDADSGTDADAISSFLADHTDGERALAAVLAVDSETTTWTFDDIAIDSGTFGELVSRGIVEKVDGEYQIADPKNVQAALDKESVDLQTETDESRRTFSLPSVDRQAMAGLFIGLLVVAGARMTAFGSVFQRGYAISPGNDPYYFRYWMGELLAGSSGVADYNVLVDAPAGVSGVRPFAHATNWLIATLLGGDQWAAETVAIWLPVLGSVALGVVIYKLAVILTQDIRVGISSVLVFAVTPVHAVYTGLGFLDHNVHQYFWLGITLLTLGWLAVDLQYRLEEGNNTREAVVSYLRSIPTWGVAVVFGLSIAFGTHAWGGSPLLLMPLAAYIGLRVVLDTRADVSPVLANLPMLVGLAIGSVLTLVLHLRWGWHSGFVSITPLLVFGGALVVAALAELWRRRDLSYRGLFVSEGIVAVVGLFVFRWLRPEDWAAAQRRVGDLFFREDITETASLFSTEYAVLLGPIYQLGMEFYIALAVLGWVGLVVYRQYEPGWLLLGTYSGFLLVLAGIQVRFAGQLAIPFSILGGLGVVYVLSVVDLAQTPAPFEAQTASKVSDSGRSTPSISLPDRHKLVYLVGIGVLIFGMSLIFVPGLTAQATYSGPQASALEAIDDHTTEFDREYPANFVLSEWGDNRMYNHFVNGESRSYGYAQNNFQDFLLGSTPDDWYSQFDGRVGYVVLTEVDADIPAESTQSQLLTNLGAGGNGTEALSHYQLLSVDDDRSAAAFVVVPGATITAPGEPGETVNVSTEVSVGDSSFTYEHEVTVGDNGQVEVIVPYAGEYSVGSASVEVTETDVLDGAVVATDSG